MILCRASLFILCFFCVFGEFSPVSFELSVPMQWLPGKTHLQNDRLCVQWSVKLYSLTHLLLRAGCSTLLTDPLCTGWPLSSHDQIPWLFRYILYMSRTFCVTYDGLFAHATKWKCFQTQLASCRVSILSSFRLHVMHNFTQYIIIFYTFCVKINTCSNWPDARIRTHFPWLFPDHS